MNFNTPSNRIQYKPVLLDNLFAYKVNPKYCVLRFGIRAAGSYFLAEVSTFMFHHVFESFKYKKKGLQIFYIRDAKKGIHHQSKTRFRIL
jgi:hypothetical protein